MSKKFLIIIVVVLIIFITIGCEERIPDPPQPPDNTFTDMKWICESHKVYKNMLADPDYIWECYWGEK